MSGLVVGIDVGGTFTDVVALDGRSGEVRAAKAPTQPDRLVDGIRASLAKLGIELAQVSLIVHGSTTCTNALLEGKQARTGFIGTRGFSDEFDIQRMVRRWSATPWSAIYDLQQAKPPPFVPRRLRREVRERTLHTGEVLEPLAPEEVEARADELRAEGVEAVAVCFLWSPANPQHELEARRVLAGRHPQLHVSISADIAPVVREYERMVTTAVNASLLPVFGTYLADVEDRLREQGFAGDLFLMQSNGGVARPGSLAARPVQTLNGGPVGGAVAAAALARRLGRHAAITCDIGGTSTDTAVILEYEVPARDELEVAYYPVRVPTADIRSIGSGGGSVAAVDAGGALRVGPESMGAHPGPACYGRGGTAATLTDANVALGRIGEDALAAGGVRVSRAAAESALAPLETRLGLATAEAAHAVVTVAVANVADSLRLQTVDRGRDPRDFTLIAFGGAGGLHATLVAEAASIAEVVIPRAPGVFSSVGMLTAEHGTYVQASFLVPAAEAPAEALEASYRALEDRARAVLGEGGADAAIARSAAMRYVLQEWELRVPVPGGAVTEARLPDLVAGFHAAHEARYGYAREDMPVEFVTLLVAAFAPSLAPPPAAPEPGGGDARRGTRLVYVDAGHDVVDVAVYDRERLAPGETLPSPCLIEETTATSYIHPGWSARVDELGNVVARREPWTAPSS